jgi:hypothetical protein
MMTLPPIKKLLYRVSADWRPFRHWEIEAESEIEARAYISQMYDIPLEELDARLVGGAK